MVEPHFHLQQAMLRHKELPTAAAPAAHLGREEGWDSALNLLLKLCKTQCVRTGNEQLGSERTTAHFETLKERFSPKDHPKSVCFSWKMPLKLLHSFSECLEHCMADNWTTKPFLVTNIFQIRPVLNSGL